MSEQSLLAEDVIRRVIQQINALWRNKQYSEIGELLSEHVVIAPPDSSERVRGRAATIQS